MRNLIIAVHIAFLKTCKQSTILDLDRHLLGRKSLNQEFRQTTGVRDPRKRIHAHEGSCLLVRTRDYGQADPILTGKCGI